MAIKGKSVIELYNPNTRIKQRYEDENIVTNAFKYLFGQNYFARANQAFMNNFLPLYKKGIGGIILFDSQIEENPDIVIAPNTIGCTGYASTNAYSGYDLSRGGMNVNETELNDNSMKFVWDFATSQANGDIACISLTSVEGGKFGYGSKNYCDDGIMYIDWFDSQDISVNILGSYMNNCVAGDYYYYVHVNSNTNITIYRSKMHYDNVKLTKYYANRTNVDSKQLQVNAYSVQIPSINSVDGKVYVYLSESSGTRIFEISDFENIKEYFIPENAYYNSRIKVRDDCVYIQTGNRKIVKYSLIDTTAKLNEITTNLDIRCVQNINNYIVLGSEIIDGNDNLRYVNYTNTVLLNESLGYIGNSLLISGAGSNAKISCGIVSNYLATINNLQTPITKTSAQTMKITYTLTEE